MRQTQNDKILCTPYNLLNNYVICKIFIIVRVSEIILKDDDEIGSSPC